MTQKSVQHAPQLMRALYLSEYSLHEIEALILLDDESPLMKRKPDPNGSPFTLQIENELESYIFSVGKSLTPLTQSIDKALLTLSLLDLKHLEQITAGNDQEKSAYIELLIENSIIRVQAIYDRTMIFANRLLDLGISNESIGHGLLVTNDHIISYGLDSLLKPINKSCNEYRFIRNSVIHHDRYSEEELDKLTTVLQAEHLLQKTKGESLISPEELAQITSDYLETKQEELIVYLSKIEGKVNTLLDSCIPIYEHKKKLLRK